MANPSFIDKNNELPKVLDFDFLKKEGLAHIQELAGENWTDFNAHDPGVTILEQLAFALTDLGYRTQMDFADLLASQQDADTKSTYFTAAEILPSNPVNTKDFRKIIIDRVKGVQNIWILPLNSFTRRRNIKGLYLALVEVDEDYQKEAKIVCNEVKDKLNKFSNLGEAFEDVILLEKQEIYLKCKIELEQDALPEKVHAQILFELQKLITRPLKFYSLKELLDRGIPVNEIFDGPRLENGFIRDEFLLEKDSIFHSSQFLNTIRSVEGVRSINHFNILLEESPNKFVDYHDELSDQIVKDVIVVDWGKKGVLGSKILTDANDPNFFSYTKDGAPINLFQREVDRNHKALKAKVKVQFRGKKEHTADIPIPKGKSFKLNRYHSIQHNFPNAYALSKNGLPEKSSSTRKAQTYQLKAYLLLFEQILSDHLEALSRFNSLFELDKNLEHSYFTQIPNDIPALYKIIGGLNAAQNADEFENDFYAAVLGIKRELDNFRQRRRRFIEHLFARLGDETFKLSPEKFNYYYSKEENQQQNLNSWLTLLEQYAELSRNKARSFDHTSPFWDQDYPKHTEPIEPNLSSLEKRIRLSLGLPLTVTKIATDIKDEVRFNRILPRHLYEIEEAHPNFSLQLAKNASQSIGEASAYANEQESDFGISSIDIDEDLFKRGIWEDNLSIIEDPTSEEQRFLLLFRINKSRQAKREDSLLENRLEDVLKHLPLLQEGETVDVIFESGNSSLYSFRIQPKQRKAYDASKCEIYRVIASYKNLNTAFGAAHALKDHLIKLNLKSEGFYVLDHILLRPRNEETRVNILLHDPTSDWSVRLKTAHNFREIEEGVKKDIEFLRSTEATIEQKKNGWFIIVWKQSGTIMARCNQKFESKSGAEQKALEIASYYQNFSDFDIYNPEKLKFKREIEKPEHPLHHYSFTLSVFLSGWTARFHDPEMRNLVEILFRKHTPAHIGINFQWLSLKDMVEFEDRYDSWLQENREKEINFSRLNRQSHALLNFAKKHVQ